jgi:hypothetical protein
MCVEILHALATEREARERAKKEVETVRSELNKFGGMWLAEKDRAERAEELIAGYERDRERWIVEADARIDAAESSLAEARRLLKAMLSNPDKISKDDARRFLSQESTDGR